MKKIRILLAVVVIGVAITGLLTENAHANPLDGWPKQVNDMRTDRVFAHGDDNLSFLNCRSTNSDPVAQFNREGGRPETIPAYNDSKARCDKSNGAGQLSSDGMFYMTKDVGTLSRNLVGFKDGQIIWSTDIDYDTSCPYYSSGTDKRSKVSAMSIGADGNLYAILTPDATPTTVCPDRFIKVNPVDGTILFDRDLDMGPGPGSGISSTISQLWTYADKILLVDQNSVLHQYDYSGVEDVTKQYQFPVPEDMGIYQLIANDQGTVFASIRLVWTQYGNVPVLYHKSDGTSGSITSRPLADKNMPIMLTDNGSVAGVWSNTLYTFDFTADSYATTSLGMPSGYTQSYTYGFIEDDNGHGVAVRGMWKANGDRAVSVDLVDLSSGALTNLYFEEGSGATNPYLSDGAIDQAVADSYLYLPICYGGGNCNNTHTAGNTEIHKIPLTGFGTPIKDTKSFSLPTTVDRDDDELTATQERTQGTSDSLTDSDKDGLSDYIESQWYPNRNNVFCGSQCAYPSPTTKDVYVEVDWMDDGTNEYKPSSAQIGLVEDMLEDKGINLHVDTGQFGGGNELATYTQTLRRTETVGQVDYLDYKNGGDGISANFSSDRNSIWRYMIYGYNYLESTSSSGWAETMGDDIFVAGGLIEDMTGLVSIDRAIADTMAHEIGHNLCLSSERFYTEQPPECAYSGIDNGDANDSDYSIENYQSVMNYRYQLTDVDDMFVVDYSNGSHGTGDHDDWSAVLGGMGGFSGTRTLLGAKIAAKYDISPDGSVIAEEAPIEQIRRNNEAQAAQEAAENNDSPTTNNNGTDKKPIYDQTTTGEPSPKAAEKNSELQREQTPLLLGGTVVMVSLAVGAAWYIRSKHK